jgi:hypothetical protein
MKFRYKTNQKIREIERKKMSKGFKILVAEILIGQVKEVSDEIREKLVDALLDTKEGGKLKDKQVEELEKNVRKLAEKIFIWSFGRQLTKEHNGNSVMAARAFLEVHQSEQQATVLRQQNELARERRESARRRVFQEGLLLRDERDLMQFEPGRKWMMVTGPTDYLYNAVVHDSLFESGLTVHVLDQVNNKRHFYRVAEVHHDNRNVIITRDVFPISAEVQIFSDIPNFFGIDLTFYGTPQQLNQQQILDSLAAKMSDRVNFPPCLYVGQEILLDASLSIVLRVDGLRNSDSVPLALARVPTENVEIVDISIKAEELSSINACFICDTVHTQACPKVFINRKICYTCGEVATHECESCRTFTYCSDACHTYDWNAGIHQRMCRKNKL